jgi:hypothetical protein
MKEKEGLISPELVWGSEFRAPSIIGLGSGCGFKFDGLHLPREWEKSLPELKKISNDGFKELLDFDCKENGLIPGKMIFDEETGILKEVTVQTKTNRESKVYLATTYPDSERGIYKEENVTNLSVAAVLQKTICSFLFFTNPKQIIYPHIDRGVSGWFSESLKVPREFLDSEKPLTNSYFQRQFEIDASNIAGRFGFTLKNMNFNDRGILNFYGVNEGNACDYQIDNIGQYCGHNIDSVWQAAVLHGIGARFINKLLRDKDHQWY